MRNFRLAAGLFALVAAFTYASTASAVLVTVANYNDDFQGPTPSTGWTYRTNSLGAIGNSANYTNMTSIPAGTLYTNTGGTLPTTGGSFASLHANGGHTGLGTAQGAAQDRYVIAAYTIQAADVTDFLSTSNFQLVNSSINDTDLGGTALDLRVYVNNLLKGSAVTLPGNTASVSTFNRALGNLVVGDTIFVAVGPAGNHGNDSFGMFDFTIQFEGILPAPEPSTGLLLGAGMLGLSIMRRRRAARNGQNPRS
jgi:fibronectin-binding autotransporter adhesin